MGPYELLEKVVAVLERLQIRYLVTGSVASMAYGEPRLTNDIDVVAAVTEQHVAPLLAAFPPEEFYVSEEGIRKALAYQTQFSIIHPASWLKVDVIIRKDVPFDESRFKRGRRIHPAKSYGAEFASPEDVIIKKMEYYREGGSEKHVRDITGILKVSAGEIDQEYIVKWAQRLGLEPIWTAIQQRLSNES